MSAASTYMRKYSTNNHFKSVVSTREKIPPYQNGPIKVEYSYSYPIDELQNIVISRIKSPFELNLIEEQFIELEERHKTASTIIDRKSTEDAMNKLKEKAKSILDGKYLKKFLSETKPLLKEYFDLGPVHENISFISDEAEEITEKVFNIDKKTAQVSDIVDRYLNAVSKYVDIQVNRKINSDINECVGCGYNMTEVYTDESGEQSCPKCHTIRYKFNLAGHKGIKNFSGSRVYDVQVTFRRELLQLQGKERVHIPEEVFEMLDHRFQSLGMVPAAEIRKLEPDEYGKTPGTSLALLNDGLQSIGYPSLYKHANKIGKKLWGWKLLDLQELTPIIIKDFNLLQVHFPYVEKQGRSSNICSQVRLLQHLRYRGVNVCLTDFKLPGMNSLIANERIFRQMCLRAGFKDYKPLFPNYDDSSQDVGIAMLTKENMVVYLLGGEDEIEDSFS